MLSFSIECRISETNITYAVLAFDAASPIQMGSLSLSHSLNAYFPILKPQQPNTNDLDVHEYGLNFSACTYILVHLYSTM